MDYKDWVPDEAIENLTLKRALQDVEDNIRLASDIFKECAPVAAMSMCHMAVHSPSEQVRLTAAKMVIDRAMGTPSAQKMAVEKPVWEKLFENVVSEVGHAIGDNE